MTASVRGLLFDLDGTLADTDPIHFRAWRQSLAPFGIALEEDDYQRQISGRRNQEIVRGFLPDLPDAQIDRLAAGKEVTYRSLARDLSATPGLHALLSLGVEKKLKLALVTNAPRENARHVLEALGLGDVFETMVVADETSRGKPDPGPYELALERLALRADEAIAFEDSPAGVVAARGAGIRTVGLLRGHDAETLVRAGATLVIGDFAEHRLTDLLAELGGAP